MRFIKEFIAARIKSYMMSIAADIKRPRMVWGYRDASGALRRTTRMSDTVALVHPERIAVEDNVYVGHYSILDGTGGLVIEEGCQIGPWVGIHTHGSHMSIRLCGRHYTEIPEEEKKGYLTRPVRIGRYTFLGPGVKIFPGGSVGKGAFIMANAVILRAVPDFAVVDMEGRVAGDTRDLDRRYLADVQIGEWYREWQTDRVPA